MIEPSVNALLLEGLQLMLIGMGIVLGFLLLLVGVLRLMSGAVLRWAPEEAVPEPLPAGRQLGGDEQRLTAVIGAAIADYRRRHRT